MAPPDAPGPDGARLEVDPIAVELGERFTAAGFELYLVGGAVRDDQDLDAARASR